MTAAEKLLDKVSWKRFREVAKENGVTRYGVTGIDLRQPGQISKVTAAILAANREIEGGE